MGTRGEGRGRSRAGRPSLLRSREGQPAPPLLGSRDGPPAPSVPGSHYGTPAPPVPGPVDGPAAPSVPGSVDGSPAPPPAGPRDARPASPPPARSSRPRPRIGLTGRTIAASIVLSLLIGGAFALLLAAIGSQHHAALGARHIRKSLIAADSLELLVLDTETGARGYIITGQPSFLQPWRMARQQIPGLASTLVRLAGEVGPAQQAQARRITAGVGSYLHDYSDPLVALARHNLAAARTPALTADGRHRVDALRARFSRFDQAGTKLAATRSAQVDAAAHRAVVAAVAAVAGSVVLILASGGWVARAVVRPVRRASRMADQVAGGDLAARLPETGRGEIGTLERSLNAMTVSLAADQGELRRTAAEQAALRRVATLVARGVPPPEVFGAVAEETGRVLQAECAAVARFGPADRLTVVGTWGTPGMPGPALDSRWLVAEGSTIGQVRQTRAPARVTDYRGVPGELSAWVREQGIGSSVGTPITVEGGVWGAIIAFSGDQRPPPPPGTEQRMLAFTELAAMAIANSESRAQLTASRARVVAAADETRRRIGRDLHDGSQQQLLSIALELRAAQAQLPPGQDAVAEQYSRTARELTGVVEDLRKLARGLHPAVLERGGLAPALKALARRSGVPVRLNVRVTGRLPRQAEVAAYYVVSEGLTNAARHAHASLVEVDLGVADGSLRLLVSDDGDGGADPRRGSGLIGLRDRVEALGGRLEIVSVAGAGTSLAATLPLATVLSAPPATPPAVLRPNGSAHRTARQKGTRVASKPSPAPRPETTRQNSIASSS